MRPVPRSVVVLALSVAIASTALLRTRTFAELFDPPRLHEVRLVMHPRDVQQLRTAYSDNTFYPADLQLLDTRVRGLGVRQRGSGSRSATKMGLLLEFDRYTAGQTFLGRQALVLDNLWQDASMVREYVAMALFARMGQPAPLESFARVYLNDDYQGVYAIVEPVDAGFIRRTLGTGAGYLYDYEWASPYYFGDLGGNLDAYKALFEPRLARAEPDATVYRPLLDMVRAVNGSGPDWRAQTERHVNLAQVLTHVAIETFLAEWDGLLGYAGVNNFYLYRPPDSERHQFFPWDRDHTTIDPDGAIFRRVGENVLVRKALTYPDLYALYLDVLEQTARASAGNDWFEHLVRDAAALTGPAAVDDTAKPFSKREQDDAVARFVEFTRRRPAAVLAQVTAARASPAFVP